jgi:hypothetical protein
MKVEYKVSDVVTIELEGETIKALMEQMSQIHEVFGNSKCKKCDGTDVFPVVREVDENKYYEFKCKKCGAKLALGAHKKGGTLFPKRKDADGKPLNDFGWVKWDGSKES